MKRRSLGLFLAAALAAAAVLASCTNPLASATSGSISIQIANNINARTLLPSIDLTPASYTVTGSGPHGSSFSQSTTGGSLTVKHLAFGEWSVTVNALNSTGTVIGSGQATGKVNTGETTTVAISVVPLSGNGSLNLSVSWTASQVEYPSIKASLTPSSGSPIDLSFNVSGNTGSYSGSTIPAGYSTLTLQLLDNGIPVMGAVEVARIIAGQTTNGSYTFTNVNQPGGTIQVDITPAMADPIPVSISGVPTTVTAGGSFTATASVSDNTSNVMYVWYLNGVSVATGSTYSLPSTTAAGYYRLDVTAFSADGTRGGSATASFQVTANAATPLLTGPAPGSIGGQKAFDSAGNIYIFTYTDGLYKVTPAGVKTRLLTLSQIPGSTGGQFPGGPNGLLGSPYVIDDNHLIFDTGESGVMELNLATLALTPYAPLSTYYYGISNILKDKNGLFIVGRTKTLVYPDGSEVQMPALPGAYMVYTDQAIYASAYNGIIKTDLSGNNSHLYSIGATNYLYGIAMGPDGSVYAGMGSGPGVVSGPITIYKLATDGTIAPFVTLPIWVTSLVSDGKQYLYAAGFYTGTDTATYSSTDVFRIDMTTKQVTLIQ